MGPPKGPKGAPQGFGLINNYYPYYGLDDNEILGNGFVTIITLILILKMHVRTSRKTSNLHRTCKICLDKESRQFGHIRD
jgi:hypothetical protein